MADIHLTVDGVSVTVPPGTNVVDAARSVGIAIPVFCYHPRMKAVGMCRMCLVAVGTPKLDRATREPVLDDQGRQVIAMMPKLQTACTTPVSEGMVVLTTTEEVQFAQRGVLEFLLTSHPLDCPVCDKGGECPLQNLTMEWGPGNSRFDYSDKMHFEKPVRLGDLILLDRERCILCGRCVRFQDEIAGDAVLGYGTRGRNWHIISKSDPPFDSKFSGNTTDICPVGALTTADFRFRARAWELRPVPSICNHCPVGCNITFDMRYQQIMRVMPRENAAVNDIWICDKGRFGHRFVESQERLTQPLVRRGDRLEPATWNEALDLIATRLADIQARHGGEAIGGLAGERLANEDLFLFQRLFRDMLNSPNLDHHCGSPAEPPDDELGVLLGPGSGTNLMELGKGTTVLVIGADPEEEAPIYRLRLRGIADRGGELIVAHTRPTRLEASATHALRYRPGSGALLARALLSLVFAQVGSSKLSQRTPGIAELETAAKKLKLASAAQGLGLDEAAITAAAERIMQADHVLIVYGADTLSSGPSLAHDLGCLLLLLGKAGKPNSGMLPLLPQGNSRGALDMGIRPDKGPGYTALEKRGLSAAEMWGAALEGRIRAMYVLGLDPAAVHPQTHAALAKLDFLIVQDMFLSETAQQAHVVLPAASVVERDGSYTNAERRVQRARKGRETPGESRPEWLVIQDIAQRLSGLIHASNGHDASSRKAGKGKRSERKAASSEEAAVLSSLLLRWDYMTVSDVALDIAEIVPGYSGITHEALGRTGTIGNWGRQTNEAFYYDGTNYENTEGIGIQYPARAEQSNFRFSVKPYEVKPFSGDQRYPFVLLVQKVLYDSDPLLRDSRVLPHVSAAYVALNTADAQRLGIRSGARVRVTSAAGSLELSARVFADMPAGSVLIPALLADAPVAQLQTGPQTRVTVELIEG